MLDAAANEAPWRTRFPDISSTILSSTTISYISLEELNQISQMRTHQCVQYYLRHVAAGRWNNLLVKVGIKNQTAWRDMDDSMHFWVTDGAKRAKRKESEDEGAGGEEATDGEDMDAKRKRGGSTASHVEELRVAGQGGAGAGAGRDAGVARDGEREGANDATSRSTATSVLPEVADTAGGWPVFRVKRHKRDGDGEGADSSLMPFGVCY